MPSFYTNGDEHGNYMPGCSNDLAKELIKTKREGIEVLILDIRGNGGGAMVEALMKKVVLNICLLLFVATANVKAQAPGEAVEYMNQMGNSFTELKDETWKYLKAVTRGQGARRVEKNRQQLVQEVRAKKNEVGKMKGFYSDNSLKNAVMGYLDMNYIVLTEDFEKILNMEDIAEQSYDLMEAYILAKEKANEKLEDAGEVLDAMNRADVNAMEQNINVMLSYSEECQAKLDTLARYNGDGALMPKAKRAGHKKTSIISTMPLVNSNTPIRLCWWVSCYAAP